MVVWAKSRMYLWLDKLPHQFIWYHLQISISLHSIDVSGVTNGTTYYMVTACRTDVLLRELVT